MNFNRFKKLLACFLLILTPCMCFCAELNFDATKKKHDSISELSFKNIMREFYSQRMQSFFVADDKQIDELPHIAITDNEKDYQTVALFHKPIEFLNSKNEVRFLVMIEFVQFNHDGSLLSCHACSAKADLYTFKKNIDQYYELVSLTKDPIYNGSWGRTSIDLEDLSKNIESLGKNLTGVLSIAGYTATGTTESWWSVFHLPEDNFINEYLLTNAGYDNTPSYEENSPLSYSYESEHEIINNGMSFYDIKIKYSGEGPNKKGKITALNTSKLFVFNQKKQCYAHKNNPQKCSEIEW